jgi:hypothetical protein
MVSVVVRCPQCGSNEVIKRGKTDTGGQRYRCRNNVCAQGLADPACPIILAQEVETDEILWAGRPRHAGCGKPWTIEPGLSSPRAAVHKRKQHNRSGFGPRGGQL